MAGTDEVISPGMQAAKRRKEIYKMHSRPTPVLMNSSTTAEDSPPQPYPAAASPCAPCSGAVTPIPSR